MQIQCKNTFLKETANLIKDEQFYEFIDRLEYTRIIQNRTRIRESLTNLELKERAKGT